MRYATHVLPLAMFIALFAPTLEVAAVQRLQVSGLFRETKTHRLAFTPELQEPHDSRITSAAETSQKWEPLLLERATSQRLAQADDRKAEADRLFQQGIQQFQVSQFREAVRSWEQALAVYREIDDRVWKGVTLGNLGNAYWSLGEYQQAINLYEQHLTIARELGDRLGEGTALGNLGNAYLGLGEYQQTIGLSEQALAIIREVGDRTGEGHVLNKLR